MLLQNGQRPTNSHVQQLCLSNQTFHLDCMSNTSPIPRTWYCPHCSKLPEFQKMRKSTKGAVTVPNSATQLDSICLCNSKAQQGDNLLECHKVDCNHGKFFHLKCLNYKRCVCLVIVSQHGNVQTVGKLSPNDFRQIVPLPP